MSVTKLSFAEAVGVRRVDAVALGLAGLLIGWTAAGGQAGVVLAFSLVLDAALSWFGHRIGGSAFTWLSLPVIGLLGWLLGGAAAWMALLGSLSAVIALTGAAFVKVKRHRLWISVLALGFIVLGVELGALTVWALLSLLAMPRLYQSALKPHLSPLWTEWAVVTMSALFIGNWIQSLIR